MSMSVPPRGDTALPPLSALPSTALGDEDALKRAFLTEYSTLSVEARADLGDAAVSLATKVVEGAFVRAWRNIAARWLLVRFNLRLLLP